MTRERAVTLLVIGSLAYPAGQELVAPPPAVRQVASIADSGGPCLVGPAIPTPTGQRRGHFPEGASRLMTLAPYHSPSRPALLVYGAVFDPNCGVPPPIIDVEDK